MHNTNIPNLDVLCKSLKEYKSFCKLHDCRSIPNALFEVNYKNDNTWKQL